MPCDSGLWLLRRSRSSRLSARRFCSPDRLGSASRSDPRGIRCAWGTGRSTAPQLSALSDPHPSVPPPFCTLSSLPCEERRARVRSPTRTKRPCTSKGPVLPAPGPEPCHGLRPRDLVQLPDALQDIVRREPVLLVDLLQRHLGGPRHPALHHQSTDHHLAIVQTPGADQTARQGTGAWMQTHGKTAHGGSKRLAASTDLIGGRPLAPGAAPRALSRPMTSAAASARCWIFASRDLIRSRASASSASSSLRCGARSSKGGGGGAATRAAEVPTCGPSC